MFAVALTSALPLAPLPAGAEQPVLADNEAPLARGDHPHEWPFSVDTGTLSCTAIGGQRVVIFSEPWRTDVPQEFGNMTLPRSVIVSANPFGLLASAEDRSLYLPFDTLETLIKRLAPYEAIGTRLCETAPAPQSDEL